MGLFLSLCNVLRGVQIGVASSTTLRTLLTDVVSVDLVDTPAAGFYVLNGESVLQFP